MKKYWMKSCLAAAVLCTALLSGTGEARAAAPYAANKTVSKKVVKELKKKVTAIVKAEVDTKDSKKTKLKKLFKYVVYTKKDKTGKTVKENYGYQSNYTYSVDKETKGFEKKYALDMIKQKKGSCFEFAALYAFLAKTATGYPVRMAVGTTNGFGNEGQRHSWTEVKIGKTWYICDTNLQKYGGKPALTYYLKSRAKMKKTYENFRGEDNEGVFYIDIAY